MESLNPENESVDLAVEVVPAVATDNQAQATPDVVPAKVPDVVPDVVPVEDFIPAGASSGQIQDLSADDVASGEAIPSGFGNPHREDGS